MAAQTERLLALICVVEAGLVETGGRLQIAERESAKTKHLTEVKKYVQNIKDAGGEFEAAVLSGAASRACRSGRRTAAPPSGTAISSAATSGIMIMPMWALVAYAQTTRKLASIRVTVA